MGRSGRKKTDHGNFSDAFSTALAHGIQDDKQRARVPDHPVVVPTAVDPDLYDLERLEASDWSDLVEFRDQVRAEQFQPEPAREPEADETRIVVSDLHGNYRNLYRLLIAAGAINPRGERQGRFWVSQLGDLIHGGDDVWQADQDSVRLGARWIDCQLVGNHDLAHLSSRFESRFSGQHQILDREMQLWLSNSIAAGSWRPAVAVDDWLVSHAGADMRMLRHDGLEGAGAAEIAEYLNQLWETQLVDARAPQSDLLNAISRRRGGRHLSGSVFWADVADITDGYGSRALGEEPGPEPELAQIIGHTAQTGNPRRLGQLWLTDASGIDRGSGVVAALIKEPADQDWQPIVLERSERPDRLIYADQVSIASRLGR